MSNLTQTNEDVAFALAIVACMLAAAVLMGYVWIAIVLGILLALSVMALIPARR